MEKTDGGIPTPIRKVVVASFIGTTVEWYDYFISLISAYVAALCTLSVVCYALAEETFQKDIDVADEEEELGLVAEQQGRA